MILSHISFLSLTGVKDHPQDTSRSKKGQKTLIEGKKNKNKPKLLHSVCFHLFIYLFCEFVSLLCVIFLHPLYQFVEKVINIWHLEFTGTRRQTPAATGEGTAEGRGQSCKREKEGRSSETKRGTRKGKTGEKGEGWTRKTGEKREGGEGKGREAKSKRGAAEIQNGVSKGLLFYIVVVHTFCHTCSHLRDLQVSWWRNLNSENTFIVSYGCKDFCVRCGSGDEMECGLGYPYIYISPPHLQSFKRHIGQLIEESI